MSKTGRQVGYMNAHHQRIIARGTKGPHHTPATNATASNANNTHTTATSRTTAMVSVSR
jgi:hypothetical protein